MPAVSQSQPPFSNLQMELLKIFNRNLSDADLLEIKLLLAKHFLDKSIDAANSKAHLMNKRDFLSILTDFLELCIRLDRPGLDLSQDLYLVSLCTRSSIPFSDDLTVLFGLLKQELSLANKLLESATIKLAAYPVRS